MKKFYFISILFLSLCLSTLAKADEGLFYLGLSAGPNWIDQNHKKFEPGYLVGGQVGYKFCNGLRGELDISYRRSCLKRIQFSGLNYHAEGDLYAWNYMGHIIYDIDYPNCWHIIPFVGIGLGYANQKICVRRIDEARIQEHKNENGFAWDALVGIAFQMSENMFVDIKYQYLQNHNSINNNALIGGVRYYF